MVIVITGATGFIGHHLVNYLRANTPNTIIPVSRTRTQEGVLNLDDYVNLPEADVLVHLAENSNRGEVNKYTHKEYLLATELLRQIDPSQCRRIIYISSAILYGDSNNQASREDSAIYTGDMYSRIKVANESLTLSGGGTVLRLANVIGAGMSRQNVVSDLLAQLKPDSMVSLRDLGPVRDFIDIEDVVLGISKAIDCEEAGIFNIGSGNGISIDKLAGLTIRASGFENVVLESINPPSQSFNVLDIEKARRSFDWAPRISLETTMKNLIDLHVLRNH